VGVIAKKGTAGRIVFHIKKYLIVYSMMAIAVGYLMGLSFHQVVVDNTAVFKHISTVFVFFMIYPMMINLNLSELPRAAKEPRPIILSLIYNFVLTPIITYILVLSFISNKDIALGIFLVMLIPGSSMSIGYTGLSRGSIEVATIALAVNFALIPVVMPLILSLVGSAYSVTIPLRDLMVTVLVVLILPMFLGDLTRRAIIKYKGEEKLLKEYKPLFSLVTMISMLFIIWVIFFLKAELIQKQWHFLVDMAIFAGLYLIIAMPLFTWLDKKASLSYRDHMGIIYLSTGKNNGTAIAIAMMAFTPLVALPAATLPLFQIIFMLVYLNLSVRLEGYFSSEKESLRYRSD